MRENPVFSWVLTEAFRESVGVDAHINPKKRAENSSTYCALKNKLLCVIIKAKLYGSDFYESAD